MHKAEEDQLMTVRTSLSPSLSRRRILLGLAAAGLGTGCVTGAIDRDDDGSVERYVHAEYRLGTGDALRIIVYGEDDLTGPFVVGSQGTISYPLVGEIDASGLTLIEFSAQLQTALERYIRNPIVSVEVTNYRPFYILGEVQRPGTYPYSARLTVQNAVATAGGFTYRANQRRVFIKHAEDDREVEYVLDSSTPVLPGDTVRIVERRF